jgi:NDP-sugar pyrophosphorylase family protein
MKAIILAAGKGTRMRELTNELPKPMLQVQGKPVLEHILQGIVAAGIR